MLALPTIKPERERRPTRLSRIANYVRFLPHGFPFKAFPRDIWLICLSNIIGAFGEGLYFWVFPLYIRQLQAGYVQLGLVFSALYGASALVLLPGGLLADRFDRKKILILGWAPWAIAPLLYSFAQNWTQLIPGTICWGLSMIGVPAVNAYVITSVNDKKKLATALSFVWSSYSLSYIFAPTVGAFLATVIGMQWVLRLSALLCGLATAVFVFLHSQHPRKDKAMTREQPMPSGGERRLWRKVLVWSFFFMAVTFLATIGRTFVPTFLAEHVGLSEFYVGLFGSINFAGITFIGIIAGRLGDRRRKSSVMGMCLLLYISSMITLLYVGEPIILMVIAFFYGSSVVVGSLVSSYVGTIAPESKRGLWVSIPQTLSLLAAFAAPYLGGYLFSQSPFYTFLMSATLILPLVAFALVLLKE